MIPLGYRPVIVRTVFTLPKRFQQPNSTPTHFAYVEYLSNFPTDLPTNPQGFFPLTVSISNQRVSAVVPINKVKLACQLTPVFNKLTEACMITGNIYRDCFKFFFNDQSFHLMYAYMSAWKRLI